MSKATLKKALASMAPEQVAELLLDLYSVRPEAKEYLEFFLNPDIDRLVERTTADITKEILGRGRRGYLRPRISHIKAMIKKVDTLNPGKEYTVRLMLNTIHVVAQGAMGGWFYTDACLGSIGRLLIETVIEADRAGILDATVTELRGIVSAMPKGVFSRASSTVRSRLSDAIDAALVVLAAKSSLA